MSTLEAPVFSHGHGSDIYTVAGERRLDLVMGFGSAFLGHAHPLVTARLQEQAARLRGAVEEMLRHGS